MSTCARQAVDFEAFVRPLLGFLALNSAPMCLINDRARYTRRLFAGRPATALYVADSSYVDINITASMLSPRSYRAYDARTQFCPAQNEIDGLGRST